MRYNESVRMRVRQYEDETAATAKFGNAGGKDDEKMPSICFQCSQWALNALNKKRV